MLAYVAWKVSPTAEKRGAVPEKRLARRVRGSRSTDEMAVQMGYNSWTPGMDADIDEWIRHVEKMVERQEKQSREAEK